MSRLLRCVPAVVAALALAVVLTGCQEDLAPGVDPAQVDAVEAPELGACRDLTLDDIAQPSNATQVVDCTDAHTAMTYAVGSLPEELKDAAYDADELGAFAFERCTTKFAKLLGADESLAMRTVLTGVVPALGGRVGRGRPLVPLRRRRRRRPDPGADGPS